MVSAAPAPSPPTQAVSVVAPPRPAGLPVPTVPQRKRFSNRVKTEAVMRVLAGESREQVAAALGATPDLLERWLDSFLNGGAAALAPKAKAQAAKPARSSRSKGPAPVEAASIDDLKAKLQSLLQTVEVLSTQIHALPAEDKAPPPALPPPAAPRPAVAPAPRSDGTASPPPGFPAEDPDPPPRLKRSRTPRPRG